MRKNILISQNRILHVSLTIIRKFTSREKYTKYHSERIKKLKISLSNLFNRKLNENTLKVNVKNRNKSNFNKFSKNKRSVNNTFFNYFLKFIKNYKNQKRNSLNIMCDSQKFVILNKF